MIYIQTDNKHLYAKSQFVISSFLSLRLWNDTRFHPKVKGEVFYVAIPKGRKSFLWFFEFEGIPTCLLIEILNNKPVCAREVKATFSQQLAYGTVLYGTSFYVRSQNEKADCFTVEDVYYYKAIPTHNDSWKHKYSLFADMFASHLSPHRMTRSFLSIRLPLHSPTADNLQLQIHDVTYPIYSINKRYVTSTCQLATVYIHRTAPPPATPRATFCVSPDPQIDIYTLKCDNKFYGYACIQTLKTSLMMNSLFRNTPEDLNLDLLQEEPRADMGAGVVRPESINMICEYNRKFKKWTPLAPSSSPVVTWNELKAMKL